MKKQDVIDYYGSVKKASDALKLTVHAIYKWPEELSERQARYVNLQSKGKLK